jgi:TolB-like protein/Flp pilus assembly protein TadD
MSFIQELKRRNVIRVAILYVTAAWLLLQLTDVLSSLLSAPPWTGSVVVLFLLLGFVPALLFSWVYEMTPEGLMRQSELDQRQSNAPETGRRINTLIAVLLVLAIVGLIADRLIPEARPVLDSSPAESVPIDTRAPAVDVLPNSVAVLPLENLSLEPGDAFFAAGIHDELLNQLAKIKDLNVIARTSVLRYADRKEMSISDIARELRVEAVMEGTVRYGGNRVRITAQLIDGESNTHLWSQTYENEFEAENIFAIESDIAVQIASALEAELLPTERASIERPPTTSTEALKLYMRAKAGITDLGPMMPPDEIAAFHRYLDQALVFDPQFGLAHALKAYEYGFSLWRTFPLSDDKAIARRIALVNEHAQAAIRLDPNLGLAHGALAWPPTIGLRRAEAQAAFDRAYELSPRDPDIVGDFGFFAAATGQSERSLALANQSLNLAPHSAQINAVAGFAFLLAGDLERSASVERQAIEQDPTFFFSYLVLGLLEASRGNEGLALENLRIAEELSTGIPSADMMSMISYGYGRIGRTGDAQRMFSKIQNMATEFHVGAASWAMASLGVGDQENALTYLLQGRDTQHGGEGFIALALLAGNGVSDPTLDQPEFIDARRSLGLRVDL